ncbi:paraquat-inducible protein A [Cupriavidus gilardii J11]|uniref:Paraquat-inducible protein A n=1 Tax=Cupriavidus gilardii J11 TaxID=936133 RepID=A0A562BMG2_9BURK|nr:paraquat-inducible protein A [Cupriavidus gilardii]TWG86261.1 paraquat-inducible protein A [Cupriavidus gilardii J11]
MSAPPENQHRHGPLRRSRELVAGVVQDLADDDSAPLAGVPTATSMGVLSCHACDALSPLADEGKPCRRCGATLHRRKSDSLARTWAFLLAAYILYIPANVLPVMTTRSILGTQEDTILSGVIYLWVSGSHLLAIVVLTASIIVPLLKMAVLTFLLLSVHLRSTWRLRQQTRLYALVELIGRWSMLDIFVVALLASLVRAGALATVDPGGGAAAFGMVVVCTMLASLSFDPRLLWDNFDAGAAISGGTTAPSPHVPASPHPPPHPYQAGHRASQSARRHGGTDPLP